MVRKKKGVTLQDFTLLTLTQVFYTVFDNVFCRKVLIDKTMKNCSFDLPVLQLKISKQRFFSASYSVRIHN